jgi:hypothetical protein
MTSRDEWFAIHAADSGDGSLTKSAGPRSLAGGFRVDPEDVPAIRAAFEEAVNEMSEARRAMNQMQFGGGGSVNPVVDKFVAALADVGYGDQGSVTMAADTAVAEYQNVIKQLDQVMAGYQETEAASEHTFGQQS